MSGPLPERGGDCNRIAPTQSVFNVKWELFPYILFSTHYILTKRVDSFRHVVRE